MFIQTAIWSIFLSLISLSFLYPLRRHHKEARFAKSLSSLMLLPATFSALYLLKITLVDQATVIISRTFSLLPFDFAILITAQNSPIVAAIVLSAVVFSFLLQNQRFVRNIFFFGMALLVLLIITTSIDLLLSATVFSIGTILLSFFSLREENNEDLVREITKDFLWQRLSDFFAFAALSWMLLEHEHTISLKHIEPFGEDYKISYGLFFLAMTMRVAIMARSLDEMSTLVKSAARNQDLNNLFVGIGSLVLLRQFGPLIFGNLEHNKFFIFIAVIILIEAIIQSLTNKDKSKTERNIRYLLASLALVAQCLNLAFISTIILCILIIVYPAMSIIIMNVVKQGKNQEKTLKNKTHKNNKTIITAVTLKIPSNISFWLSSIFSIAIVPIYSNLLLYRLPQLAIWIIQTPLRIFHNGSIKRSLLFTIIVLYSYYSAWRPQ